MAVGQARTTRSRRNQRRAHDGLKTPTLSRDSETGERHRRHHMTSDGYYRGREVLHTAAVDNDAEE